MRQARVVFQFGKKLLSFFKMCNGLILIADFFHVQVAQHEMHIGKIRFTGHVLQLVRVVFSGNTGGNIFTSGVGVATVPAG